jgi:hypothetical protein
MADRFEIINATFALAQSANAERGKVSADLVENYPAMVPANFPKLSAEMQNLLKRDIDASVKEVAKLYSKATLSTFKSQYSRFFTAISCPANADIFAAWRNGDFTTALSVAYENANGTSVVKDWTHGKALDECIRHNVNLDKLVSLIREYQHTALVVDVEEVEEVEEVETSEV